VSDAPGHEAASGPELPYRPNVGAALFNRSGLVFVGLRAGMPARTGSLWQLPQGGIDEGESPRNAVLRELEEEIGTANAEVISEYPDWLTYDLPLELQNQAFRGRFRGQRQRWFALRFLGADSDIRLDAHAHPEFAEWRWVELAEIPSLAVSFKRPIYEIIARDFAPFARPV
jgi:putative (di)nucleoside polyphosphate hydrolase